MFGDDDKIEIRASKKTPPILVEFFITISSTAGDRYIGYPANE